jgi:hypothetical protein
MSRATTDGSELQNATIFSVSFLSYGIGSIGFGSTWKEEKVSQLELFNKGL